jgi:hypothetical protein
MTTTPTTDSVTTVPATTSTPSTDAAALQKSIDDYVSTMTKGPFTAQHVVVSPIPKAPEPPPSPPSDAPKVPEGAQITGY